MSSNKIRYHPYKLYYDRFDSSTDLPKSTHYRKKGPKNLSNITSFEKEPVIIDEPIYVCETIDHQNPSVNEYD